MNKLDVHVPTLTNLPPMESVATIHDVAAERSHRLIVLIPPASDCTSLTRRICRLAGETNSDILLLGVCKDASQELSLKRQLVTVSALIRDARVFVDIRVEAGTSWLDAVKHNFQGGDMLVCITNPSIGIRRRPLSQILESSLDAPLYILSEGQSQETRSNIFSQSITWSGFIGIIAGFFILQVRIAQLPKDMFQTLLFILLLLPEFGLLWVWNSLFS